MSQVRKLILEDIRCFSGRQEVEIRPITLIVGENSTGKSTILGCLQAITKYICPYPMEENINFENINFNISPLQMGEFKDIISKGKQKSGNLNLGFEIIDSDKNIEVLLKLVDKKGKPEIDQAIFSIAKDGKVATTIKATLGDFDLTSGSQLGEEVTVEYDKTLNEFTVVLDELSFPKNIPLEVLGSRRLFNRSLNIDDEEFSNSKESASKKKLFNFLNETFNNNSSRRSRLQRYTSWIDAIEVKSFAPIQSSPKPSYNPAEVDDSQDSKNMPFFLRNLHDNYPEYWDSLKEEIKSFTEDSEMFTDFKVKDLTKSKMEPFQLQFKIRGKFYNFTNIGYGTSQIMPILVDISTADIRERKSGSLWKSIQRASKLFLMQQPEIHLHPKAQSEFISFLINTIDSENRYRNQYIIETHSDYFVDRARIEIKKGNISHDDVSLVYLEAHEKGVKVHNMTFDDMGNFENQPEGYRSFFLQETRYLFGLD